MKRIFILFFVNSLSVLVQTALLPDLMGRFYVPNIVIVLGLALLIVGKSEAGFASVLIGGLLLDFILNKIPGASSVVLVSILLAFHYLRRIIFKNYVYVFLLGWLSSLVYSVVIYKDGFSFVAQLVVGSAINGIAAVLTTRLVKTIYA